MGTQFISWDINIGHSKIVYISNDISSETAQREHNLCFVELSRLLFLCCKWGWNVFLGTHRVPFDPFWQDFQKRSIELEWVKDGKQGQWAA